MSVFRIRIARAVCLTAAAAAATITPPATAQLGEAAGFQEAMVPDFFKRDAVLFVDSLGLDESQRAILEQLLLDYQDDFDAGTQAMIDKFQDMLGNLQGGDQAQIMQLVFKPIEEWAGDKRLLKDQFLQTIKDILLTDQQLERWPEFERKLNREKLLPKGVLSGEDLNLFLVMKELDLEPSVMAPVQPILQSYEIALDESLLRRDSIISSSLGAMTDAMRNSDPAIALQVIDRQIAARVEVRTVNLQYVGMILEVLPGGATGAFQERALARAFPRVYRPTPVERMFEAAQQLETVEPAVVSAIIDLEAAYLSELAVLNAQLAEITQRAETERHRLRAQNFAAKMRGEMPRAATDTSREEFQRRDALGETYMRLLQALLTEEQFLELPGAQRWVNRTEDRNERAMNNLEAMRAKQRMLDESDKRKSPGAGQEVVDDPSRGVGPSGGGGGKGGGEGGKGGGKR